MYTKHFDSDGGTNNWKCVRQVCDEKAEKKHVLASGLFCGNHSQRLCDQAAMDSMDDKLQSQLYSITKLFKMGSYFFSDSCWLCRHLCERLA